MPITPTLSRKFYEKFGDEVTNELVNWLNAVDQSYRQEFRELFSAHFGQLRAEMETLRAELRAEIDLKIGALRAELLVAMASQKAEFHEMLAASERRLLRWLIGLWIATLPAMAGMVYALRQLGWL